MARAAVSHPQPIRVSPRLSTVARCPDARLISTRRSQQQRGSEAQVLLTLGGLVKNLALSASMWSVSSNPERVSFVWQVEGDRSAGEQHERERGFGGVKAVGAAGDEANLVVQSLGASLVDPEADRGEDPVAVLADRLAELDERREPAAGEAGQEPVDQHGDVVDREAGLEDPADGFLERVGAPDLAAGGLEPGEDGRLLIGEPLGLFEQRPAGVLEAVGDVLVAEEAQFIPVAAADLVQRR